jgi:hypothetical protein
MTAVPEIPLEAIEKAFEDALSAVLPDDLGERPHLARALTAQRFAAVANHCEHSEVAAANAQDGMSWDDIGHAFGISPSTARERFRTAPMGLPG